MSGINDIKSTLLPNVNTAGKVSAGNKKSAENTSSSDSLPSNAADKVSLTDTATQLQALQKKIADAPEVNQARVAEIKAAIEDGSYKVDSQELARKMIDFEGDF